MHEPIVFTLFLIFTGAAVLATVGLFTRQSLLVVYILLGVLLGPWGLGWVAEPGLIRHLSLVGVVFLLFLLGLNLHPQRLLGMLREATRVTLLSSLVFGSMGVALARLFGFAPADALMIGAAAMFSSTIIGLKLLPTTELHHRHTGEVIIAVLLLQDLMAILILLLLQAISGEAAFVTGLLQLALALPVLFLLAVAGARWLLVPLLARFDTVQEYVFLMALGWCLGVAELARAAGLSLEMGAFIAGVALATHPISFFIAESLKPLRDFFLVLFFFSLGAAFDLSIAATVWLPALALAGVLMVCKPLVFRYLLGQGGESSRLAWEVGVRLGQVSEFSLFIAVLAAQVGVAGIQASYTIQLATLLTFVASSYLIMLRYPTPIAVSARLRQD